MTALVVGTLLAVAALAFVLAPLFRSSRPSTPPRAPGREPSAAPTERAVAALREIEFDHATGKLSESDYAELKATYTARAIAAMRADDAATSAAPAPSDDAIEAKILAYRMRRSSCPSCGPRPEVDAIYCSSCGRYLASTCSHCGAPVSEPGARYCSACGRGLAA